MIEISSASQDMWRATENSLKRHLPNEMKNEVISNTFKDVYPWISELKSLTSYKQNKIFKLDYSCIDILPINLGRTTFVVGTGKDRSFAKKNI